MLELAEAQGGRSAIVKIETIDPMSLTLEQIRYDPNPFKRLVRMHSDHHEMTTGTVFRSPFPRSDARFR